MKNNLLKTFTLTALSLILSFTLKAQPHKLSPHDTTSAEVHGSKITIIYGSPSVKGRKIWGGLIPFDKAWRLGADEATLFTTSKDIEVQGKKLVAGTYTMFAIPGNKVWNFVFNSETGQWGIKRGGEANYDESKTVLKVTAEPVDAQMEERLKFIIDSKGFTVRWEKLAVPVMIQ